MLARKRRACNPERDRHNSRVYRARNAERLQALGRQRYAQRDPEKVRRDRAYHRAYHEQHREKKRAYRLAYYSNTESASEPT